MTKRIASIYDEHKPSIKYDSPTKKISKLIRLLKFTEDQTERANIINQIQYYQDLDLKINDKNQLELFD
jgi:hypothetical protein